MQFYSKRVLCLKKTNNFVFTNIYKCAEYGAFNWTLSCNSDAFQIQKDKRGRPQRTVGREVSPLR